MPIEQRPEVTVVIPTRNRRRFLEQSVRDALGQVDVDLEVVIVDDGSTDVDAVEGIEALDPRISLVRHDRRRGVARARNTGVANAHHPWLAFLDDDDRWAPTKLRTLLGAAAAAHAQWVYGAALTIDQDDRLLFVERPRRPPTVDWLGMANPVPGGCSNVVARTELVRDVGGFDEELALLADWDLWIRLGANAPPAVSDEVLVAYRLHPGNMHIRNVEAGEVELAYVARKHGQASERAQRDLRAWPALPWQAKAYRRAGRPLRAARLYLQRWRLTHDPRDIAQALISLLGERTIRMVRRRITQRKLPHPAWLDSGINPGRPAPDPARTEAAAPVGEAADEPLS